MPPWFVDYLFTVEGKRSKLESESSSTLIPTVAQVEERGHGSTSAPNISGSMPRSSGSSPPSAGGFATQSEIRRPSLSASPALYSDVVNSPVKADPYSPGGSSPAMSTAYTAKDFRQPSRGKSRQPGYSGSSHYSAGQSPYQSPVYRTSQGESLQDTKLPATDYISAIPRRPSRTSPPVPPLVHQDSTISSDSANSVPTLLSLIPNIDQGKPGSRTLPQPINFAAGAPRTSLLDLRSSQAGSLGSMGPSLPPISAAGGHLDPQRSSNWPALLRATELAREAALKGTDDLQDQDDSS